MEDIPAGVEQGPSRTVDGRVSIWTTSDGEGGIVEGGAGHLWKDSLQAESYHALSIFFRA